MDLIERLREYETWSEDWRIIKEAADEIERLREALRAINRKNDNPAWFNPDIHEIIETALQKKESE